MNFIDNVNNTLNGALNLSTTENGAVGYSTSGSMLLDLDFAVTSLRNVPEELVAEKFCKAFFENRLLAVKWLFFAGDVREGLGERRLFRICLTWLANTQRELTKKLLPLVAEYTRWDNLLPLLNTSLKDDVVALIKEQLLLDEKAMKDNKPISLLAKWMPSVSASSLQTREYAKILVKSLNLTQKEYRTKLVALRKYLDVVEIKMSANRWGEINYSTVPSKANAKYSSAFLKKDEERRNDYLQKLTRGEVKINASVLFPHDIVHKYTAGRYTVQKEKDLALEAMWKALPDYVKGDSNTLCVPDGSGSMMTRVGNTGVSCLDVANALAIYFAERCSGQFKDTYITFSEKPQIVSFKNCNSLIEKITVALAHDEIANTNIEAVFDLILKTAIDNKLKQKDLPKNILILSDMEFDYCANSADGLPAEKRLFDELSDRFTSHGYKLPRLIFWNICSRTNTIPLKENALGVALVSGFSPAVVQMVLGGDLDPLKCLLNQLSKERYDAVEKAYLA